MERDPSPPTLKPARGHQRLADSWKCFTAGSAPPGLSPWQSSSPQVTVSCSAPPSQPRSIPVWKQYFTSNLRTLAAGTASRIAGPGQALPEFAAKLPPCPHKIAIEYDFN